MMYWKPVPFGKYGGKTLPQIFFEDPCWFYYINNSSGFKDPKLASQANLVDKVSRQIRPYPDLEYDPRIIEYNIDYQGDFIGFDIITDGRPLHQGSTFCWREPYIDMSKILKLKENRRKVAGWMISSILEHFFDSDDYKISKHEAEMFFTKNARFFLNQKREKRIVSNALNSKPALAEV